MQFSGESVLVTGATGFLGGVIIRQLSESGATVRALARRPERDAYIRDLDNVEIVQGDVTDMDRLREITSGVDYVIHSAAALGGSLALQSTVNVHGTYNVGRAAADCGVKRFVHVSTISVYGYGYRHNVTEQTPLNPGADPYHITKAGAEKTLHEVGARHGLSYSIVRPGMIYGPRSQMWTKTMFKVARRGLWLGDGSGSAYPIHVEDVAALCLTLLTHPAAEGEAFHCTPDPSPTWREFLSGYAALAGRHRWISLPSFVLQPFLPVVALLSPENARTKDARDLLPFLLNHITYRMDKARDLLGWSPQISLADGIAGCAPYLREKGLLSS